MANSDERPDTARPSVAVIIGATGGIGAALLACAQARGVTTRTLGLSRRSAPSIDLTDEASVAAAAAHVAATGLDLRLLIDATGFLHDDRDHMPEKSWQDIDPIRMAHVFAVNAIGVTLLMKHFFPMLPRQGRSVFATLSARVGSISDNQLGGWYSYRASKAALNQFVRTGAIELSRRRPQAICVALHPGTVSTGLSQRFQKSGLDVQTPDTAAARLLDVIADLTPAQTGCFFDHHGKPIPW